MDSVLLHLLNVNEFILQKPSSELTCFSTENQFAPFGTSIELLFISSTFVRLFVHPVDNV